MASPVTPGVPPYGVGHQPRTSLRCFDTQGPGVFQFNCYVTIPYRLFYLGEKGVGETYLLKKKFENGDYH